MNEIRCSECGSAWLVDGTTADGMQCPTCLRPLIAAAAEAGGASRLQGTELQEIVCPRCQLHFYPSGRHHAAPAGHRPRILVVEDQEYFRTIATHALEEHYEVIVASSTIEARVALQAGDVDLMVLDLTLEEEPGRVLMSELVPKPCPILIFTAQDERELYGEDWEELKRLGADDVVVKGMHVAESLARKVGRLLGRPEGEE
jgi:CheY-like chemotaxis protein